MARLHAVFSCMTPLTPHCDIERVEQASSHTVTLLAATRDAAKCLTGATSHQFFLPSGEWTRASVALPSLSYSTRQPGLTSDAVGASAFVAFAMTLRSQHARHCHMQTAHLLADASGVFVDP